MADQPVLSICVPSRNRQIYFQETIRALTATARRDVEFVFADNSDDPEIMNQFMNAYRGDPRIVYLPSGPQAFSMMDNWERAVAAANGRWVSAIGDDDYLDPDVAAFLVNLESKAGPVDALTWTGFNYNWPGGRHPVSPLSFNLTPKVAQFDKRDLMRRAFQWEGAIHVPLCGNSLYHGAISRDLLHTIRKTFGSRFFEQVTVDYEIAFKIILTGKSFYNVSRPFSILGACPLSHSAAAGNLEAEQKIVERTNREVGHDIDADPFLADIPFRTSHGVTAIIFQLQHRISRKYGIPMSGYEENFVRSLARCCAMYTDRQSYDIMTERCRTALASWHGGRYLSLFEPAFHEQPPVTRQAEHVRSTGIDDQGNLHFYEDAGGARTPGELFSILGGFMIPADEIEIAL